MTLRLAPLLLVLALASPALAAEDDPHGHPERCVACHEAGSGPSEPGAPLDSVSACTACHPGRERDMHAVGMTPVHAPIPAGWPASDGVVSRQVVYESVGFPRSPRLRSSRTATSARCR